MRIHVLSDLHMEFGKFTYPKVEADLVILAGDIHTKLNGLHWIQESIPNTPVLYLMGNHEFYGTKTPSLIDKLRAQAEGSNIHIMENDTFELEGYRFIGSTLWTDMNLHGDTLVGSVEAGSRMNDYKRIRRSDNYRKLSPKDTRISHASSVAAIENFLKSGDPRRSIVVTHHAPSIRSLPKRRREEPISCAYASHLDPLIEEATPLLWIHGHIHHSHDYMIGTTRVVSNPRAYVDDPNPNFNPELVIDLDRMS